MAHYAVTTLGTTYHEALDMPVCSIAVMMRQSMYIDGVEMMHLSEIEQIDNKQIKGA